MDIHTASSSNGLKVPTLLRETAAGRAQIAAAIAAYRAWCLAQGIGWTEPGARPS